MAARLFFCLIVFFTSSSAVFGQADEPSMERLVLADGTANARWHVAEATMELDATRAREGRAWCFHIDVNHETGQPEYPIGWPRTHISVPQASRDWREWDFIEFWVFGDTSRDSLPNTPLGFIVHSPNKPNSYKRIVDEVQKGTWTHVRIPTSDIPNPADCTRVQFYISESDYNHGDVLDFWIDDLALVRYAEPTIIGVRPLSHVHYADVGVVRVQVKLTGLATDQTAQLVVRLVRDGATLCRNSSTVGPGKHTVPLKLGGSVPVGHYAVEVNIAGSKRILTEAVRIISSPWQEEKQ